MAGRRLIVPPSHDIALLEEWRLETAVGGVFERFCRYVWPHCGVPGRWGGPDREPSGSAQRYEWREADREEFDRAVEWLLDSLLGPVRDAQGFSEHRNALTRVTNPIYEGEPILPGHLRASFEVGIVGAARSLGDMAPYLCGAGFLHGVRNVLREAFARLSDGVRIRIGELLKGLPELGESVKQMLARAARKGEAPVEVARRLRDRLDDIGSQHLRRLVGTEVDAAVEKGKQGEYVARGFRIPGALVGTPIRLPKYHQKCRCVIEIQEGTGYLIPVTQRGACEVCLLWESRAHALMGAELRMRRGEAGAAQDGGDWARDALPVPRSVCGYRPLRTRWSVPRPADWPSRVDKRDPWVARLTDAEAQAVRRYARSP